ncbi:chromobox protein homolog 1-like [Sitodiplosis mosellana]|uniref:chromobox protein homolog 1-like n=1 Tax=Sitodiplosis mosellana TaxID=263140 RepID=UPI0024437C99|nr:chromobox protein homolog 1-like [Sitodiplosis mosellana]
MAKKMIDENANEDVERESRMEKDLKMEKEPKIKKESKVKKESKSKSKKEQKTAMEKKSTKESKTVENEMTPPLKTKKRSTTKSTAKKATATVKLWFEPECILGATDCWNGEMAFRFKAKDSDSFEFVPAKVAKIACPQLVINFYQDRLVFSDDV